MKVSLASNRAPKSCKACKLVLEAQSVLKAALEGPQAFAQKRLVFFIMRRNSSSLTSPSPSR
eukprot:CAMPEP_0197646604 /NCGR_PEP_ID=MMETSP1338-20131121/23750_1 /TAXON_ID=43686 ORGANISM="Pelagodinium beii, Strain RCC1491" /NCGR_SAMPLE_ID=MMETSP1338 /ASSEMBLY_ACC=CAM_ASM_000754 /LENGTH=61 /DNA_ID=CAMNT_0043220255 /DNA_START=33 /DNA_END=215 /DNA_ORIENTATION=+